jgi:hypothetical protein
MMVLFQPHAPFPEYQLACKIQNLERFFVIDRSGDVDPSRAEAPRVGLRIEFVATVVHPEGAFAS